MEHQRNNKMHGWVVLVLYVKAYWIQKKAELSPSTWIIPNMNA